jgi:hypothetical protein
MFGPLRSFQIGESCLSNTRLINRMKVTCWTTLGGLSRRGTTRFVCCFLELALMKVRLLRTKRSRGVASLDEIRKPEW